jgi:glycosyltransferase involved in cell wall biosynthesis
VNPDEYFFTVQKQSMFDASIPGLPHFLYTDHTELANLQYPSFDASTIDPHWLELEKTIYQRADINFVRSTHVQRSMIEDYGCPPQKVALVYAGSNVTIDPHRQIDPAKYHSKRILFVGVDWPRKGGPQLVAAFKRVLQAHPDAHLTIVGCSPQVDVPNCTVVGKLTVDELSPYYDQAAVFCMPTRREPFGVVFIEAFSHKLPIVATRLGALPDFVLPGESGYLVDPINNVEQLAEALIDLLGNPAKCQAFGERGYQIALQRYTWENTSRLIREHIEQAIGPEYFLKSKAVGM